MRSLLLRVTSGFLLPVLVVFSLWVVVRGHDDPGGGFVGGLIAAAAFALRGFACGARRLRAELRLAPEVLIGAGLLTALVSGLVGLAGQGIFLAAQWLPGSPLGGLIGTPLAFDFGIYLVVLGGVLAAILALSEAGT